MTIWHWMSDRDDAFNELAKRYTEETGVNVKFDLYAPSEIYSQRVKGAIQTNTLPDIFGVLGENQDFASFIQSGYVADLTEALNAPMDGATWKEAFFEKALAVNEFKEGNPHGVKPGIYGLPLDVSTIRMIYNKNLYAKAGLDPNAPPKTWEEFMEHSRILKAKGLPGFVSGFGEIWMLDALASNWAMNLMGPEKVFATYEGKVPYTDRDWIKIFALFKEMADEGVLVDGTVTMVNKAAEQTFANERATYAFNGSWCVNVYKGMNPDLDYAAFLPPLISKARPMKIWGGAGSSFVIHEASPRKEAAIAFLKWLTSDAQQVYLAESTLNLPANKNAVKEISPILSQFAGNMDHVVHPNVYPVHEKPEVREAFDKGIQSILIGEKTPEELAAEVQKVKGKALKR
ncbi:MAG: extracellular solute-binding protein [Candidatus Omnitrophica bacterium]|nr:extracellular solute-binding protein [Candidatus Omnitrophota bacterium]